MYKTEACFFGTITLARPVLLWPLFALSTLLLVVATFCVVRFVVATFCVVHFGVDLFGTNFMKIIFLLLFSYSNFSIFYEKNFSIFLFIHLFIYFLKQSKIFCLFLVNFFPLYKKKKYKFNAPLLFFLFCYCSNI